jgi:hypothetical protein
MLVALSRSPSFPYWYYFKCVTRFTAWKANPPTIERVKYAPPVTPDARPGQQSNHIENPRGTDLLPASRSSLTREMVWFGVYATAIHRNSGGLPRHAPDYRRINPRGRATGRSRLTADVDCRNIGVGRVKNSGLKQKVSVTDDEQWNLSTTAETDPPSPGSWPMPLHHPPGTCRISSQLKRSYQNGRYCQCGYSCTQVDHQS